jgi:signal transduction histidine kinase
MTTQAVPSNSLIGAFDQLELLVGASPYAIAVFDREMRYQMVNQRWLDNQLNGVSLIGSSHYDLFPETPAYWRERHQRALNGESLSNEHERLEGVIGRTQLLSWRIFPWYAKTDQAVNGNGHRVPDGIVIMMRDINAEQVAHESLENAAILLENQQRAQELETVAQVSAAAATILDVEELLQTVVDLTKERFGLYHAHIYLLNEAGDTLDLATGAGEVGQLMKSRGHHIAVDHPLSLVARCARSRTAVIANDVQQAANFLPNPLLPNTRSEMAVPMVVGDQLVGVLDLQSDKLNNFTEIKARVKTILGNQIAVAVRTARIFSAETEAAYRQVQQRAMELEATLTTVTKASTAAATLPDAEDLLFTVATLTKESFKLYHAHIYLLDATGTRLVLTAGAGDVGRALKAQGHAISLDNEQSIVARVGRTRQAVIVNDVRQSSSFMPNKLLPDTRSEMAVPMIVANELIGVLDVQSERVDRFTDIDIQVKSSLGAQVALAVKNIRTRLAEEAALNENQQRAQELQIVAEVGSAAATILDMDKLLQTVVDLTKERFGLYHAHIYLLNEAGNTLELAAGAGEAGRIMKERGHSISFNHPASLVARSARSQNAVIANDVRQAVDFLPNALLPNTRAEMAVPMIVGDKLVGVLDLQSDRVDNFTEIKAQITTILGNQIAVAVQNARSFAQTQQDREDAQQLAELDGALAQAGDEQQVLQLLSAFARRRNAASIALYFTQTDANGDVFGVQPASILAADGTPITNSIQIGQVVNIAQFPIFGLIQNNPNEPLFIEDAADDPRPEINAVSESLVQLGTQSLITLPLRTGNKWQGMISFRWSERQEFPDNLRRLMTSLIPTASAVIANRRAVIAQEAALLENTLRAQELETVAQVSAAAANLLNVDSLLNTVVELTKERFGLYHAHVYLLNEAGDTLELATGAGEAGRLMKERGHSIAFDNPRSLVARCARSQQAVISNDVQHAENFLPNPLLPNTRSEMAVPMVVGDLLVGVLDLQSDKINNFTEAKARVKTILGNQIAVAIQNARQYAQQAGIAEQLRTVDRLKSEFLASMSHELRTPLNSIIGYSRMLLDGISGDLPEEVTEDLGAIHYGGQHLLSLINDILDLAKIEAGRLDIDPHPVNLLQLAEEVGRMTSVLVTDKPVSIVFDIDPELPELWADLVRVRQILNNLISNAIKFTERGEVRLTATYEAGEDMVMLAVSDTGVGIDPERLPYVFERFYQADSSSSRKAGGTGLGLTITQHLVSMHGGRIWAESTLGKGSSFCFTLPVVAERTVAQ